MREKNKIYIAGKVTGEPVEECAAKFAAAKQMLEDRGFEVVNPMEVVTDRNTPWLNAMRMCFRELRHCNAIYLLPCAVDSKGAQMEWDYAMRRGFDIYYELENVTLNERAKV